MKKNKIQSAIAGLLDMFRPGEIPEKIAIATNPGFDVFSPTPMFSKNHQKITDHHLAHMGGMLAPFGRSGRLAFH